MNDLTIYDTLAESWWQAGSKLHMLARMNPARFTYFDTIVEHWQGLRVLDLGCGGGLTTACLAQRGAAVVGVDLSRASLQRVVGPNPFLLPTPALMLCGVPMCWNISLMCPRL